MDDQKFLPMKIKIKLLTAYKLLCATKNQYLSPWWLSHLCYKQKSSNYSTCQQSGLNHIISLQKPNWKYN